MSGFPDTRASLILKLADARDAVAWDEFTRIYEPVVYRLARRRGFQHADAEELVQESMLAISRAIEDFSPDPQRGRFRDWLHRIARNLMINFLTRRKHQVWGTGDTDIQRLLEAQCGEAQCGADSAVTQIFDIEFRREVFRSAANRVQKLVKENTWQAFWLSTIEDLPIGEVARRLSMSVGSVYIARSRVMARLHHAVQQIADGN